MSATIRSSFNVLNNVFPHPDEKALRYSFYNAIAIFILFLFCATGYSIYYILQAFIKPLFWAMLVGVCLFPFKKATTKYFRDWLINLEKNNQPLVFGIIFMPFSLFHEIAESFVYRITKYAFYIILTIVIIALVYTIYETGYVNTFFYIILYFFEIGSKFLNHFELIYTFKFFLITSIIFLGSFLFFYNNENNQIHLISYVISFYWFYFALFLLSFAGVLQFPLFLLVLIFSIFGNLIHIDRNENQAPASFQPNKISLLNPSKRSSSILELANRLRRASSAPPSINQSRDQNNGKDSNTGQSLNQTNVKIVKTSFIFLFWSHVAVAAWTRKWPFQLACVLLFFASLSRILKRIGIYEGLAFIGSIIVQYIEHDLDASPDDLSKTSESLLVSTILPKPIRNILNVFLYIDMKLRYLLDACLDSVVSLFLIILVLLAAVFFTIFIVFQIHEESLNLVSLTSNLMNNTLNNEFYDSFLPVQEEFNSAMNIMIKNVFEHSNTWISQKLDQMFENNPENKQHFEGQLLQLWEKLYYSFINQTTGINEGPLKQDSNESALILPCENVESSFFNLISFYKTPTNCEKTTFRVKGLSDLLSSLWTTLTDFELLDFSKIAIFVRENLGLMSTVLESVWALLRSNIYLLFTFLTTILSLVFGSSTVLLNFFVSTLIFLTALYYLLASSGEEYLPMEFIGSLLPSGANASSESNDISQLSKKSFHSAVESAISSVFAATFKLALFYGFYTVLTHQIFGIDFVVIPAALFGAVPILGNYWVALPGILELAFLRGFYWRAALLFLFHWLPTQFLDTAVYSEIKGAGHPYLTGLSIAGGVYCYGIEGALMGPIVLCCLLVAVNLFRVFLHTPVASSYNELKLSTSNIINEEIDTRPNSLNHSPLGKRTDD